ncbi:MAG: sigma-54 dependent transcriptional regulator [Bacteroidota bacterium]
MDGQLQTVKQRFGIIGHSDRLNHAIQVAMQVAQTDISVLITGESGTGKESFSKIIHGLSKRKHNNFIAINCGAIPEGTIDSELFGHEKGAFTGATEARKGYFEVTDGGTIFLDEVGEMPLQTQTRLLRVLENGEFLRVGSNKIQKTDTRIVAATNVNLIDKVSKGKFRDDLYFRLSSVPISVPPLRERGRDIDLLFRKFASDFAEKYHTSPVTLNETAKELLLKFPFPGNVRQLRNLVEHISVLEVESRQLNAETLARYLPKDQQRRLPVLREESAQGGGLENFSDRELLYNVLFDMRRDISELKQMLFGLMGQRPAADFTPPPNQQQSNALPPYLLGSAGAETPPPVQPKPERYESNIQDIELEEDSEEEESLSLEQKEKEIIQKALKKNGNKRKYAAQDLGISERTLYRKIKQYELDA